jgi:hypothetical protein
MKVLRQWFATCSQPLVGRIVLPLNDLAGFKVSLDPTGRSQTVHAGGMSTGS